MANIKSGVDIDLGQNQLQGLVMEWWDAISLPVTAVEGRIGYHQIYKVPMFWNGFAFQKVATWDYVNSMLGGLSWKDDARVATTGDITIATALQIGETIDGVVLIDGDRVLVKDQTSADENGVWVAGATPARATDMDASAEFNNAMVQVEEGTVNVGTIWRCLTLNPVVGTDDIEFDSFNPTVADATESVKGVAALARIADVDGKTDDSRIVTVLKLWHALQPIQDIVDAITPASPEDLGGMDLVMTLYDAYEAGTGTLRIDVTDDTTPDGVASDFGDGKSGTLSAEIDSVEDGSRVLTVGDDSGTYTSLIIDSDIDPYLGEMGEGLYQQLVARVRSAVPLTYAQHTYQLRHSTSGDSNVKTFRVDDPGTVTIGSIVVVLPVSSTRWLSGVPSLEVADGIELDFDIVGAVGKHYSNLRVGRISGGEIETTDIDPPVVPPIEDADIPVLAAVANVADGVYSEGIELTITGYNSKDVAGTLANELTGARVDTVADESERYLSGAGQYPLAGYGGAYNSEQTLVDGDIYEEELQKLNGKYKRPAGDYSGNLPTAGPDYSGTNTDNDWDYVLFSPDTLIAVSGFTLNILDAENFSGIETVGVRIYIKVEGITGWLDANVAYPGTGSPASNGDACMVYSESMATEKRVTFGSTVRSGLLHVRIGLPAGSTKAFSGITITDIV